MKRLFVYLLDIMNLVLLVKLSNKADIQFQPFKITSDDWEFVTLDMFLVIFFLLLSGLIKESVAYDAGYEDGYEDGISDGVESLDNLDGVDN